MRMREPLDQAGDRTCDRRLGAKDVHDPASFSGIEASLGRDVRESPTLISTRHEGFGAER
jgi:hypothetical protein